MQHSESTGIQWSVTRTVTRSPRGSAGDIRVPVMWKLMDSVPARVKHDISSLPRTPLEHEHLASCGSEKKSRPATGDKSENPW